MKIAMLSPSFTRAGGGVPFVVKAHARTLQARGNSVRIFALEDAPITPSERDDWSGLDVTAFPVVGSMRYGFSPKLLKAVLQEKPDVLHVHGIWQFHCVPALLHHMRYGTPYIVSPHGMLEPWIRARSRVLKSAVGGLYQNRFLRKASSIHVLTLQEGGQIKEVTPEVETILIPNFVSDEICNTSYPAWWRKDFHDRDVYLFLGRLHEKKGCVELCEAWELANANEKFRAQSALVFCGPSDGIQDFETRVAELGKKYGNVVFAGPQYGEAKQRSLAHATFLCLPSKSEGLPATILEAWAVGVIPIMTRGCNLDIGFVRGAAMETGTSANLIYKTLFEAMALSQPMREIMSNEGRLLISEMFSENSAADSLVNMYRRAIDGI